MDKQFARLEGRHLQTVPFSQYQYVDVVFSSTPDQDTFIAHDLNPRDPDSVRYEVVGKDRAGDVYHDQSTTRLPWAAGFLYLRNSVASARVRLRLSLESEN